ncbi:MAG: cyclodeaminase/cyclohydrolase family protein [Candidatus Marinimicrobia bacterium]|nr:cyclodeaminase/cyclohydrolase family protein [Candidatus Neomarinimicrobiota bacterium]MDD5582047.1 cyclodeaminase/cyclohydrolase family protein [Candidatus Neomarinimicrobiota bacterium]
MNAYHLPQKNDKQKKHQDQMIELAIKNACKIPLHVIELSYQALTLCREMEKKGNQNSRSDASVGARMAQAAIKGAADNAKINLKSTTDITFIEKMTKRVDTLLEKIEKEQEH